MTTRSNRSTKKGLGFLAAGALAMGLVALSPAPADAGYGIRIGVRGPVHHHRPVRYVGVAKSRHRHHHHHHRHHHHAGCGHGYKVKVWIPGYWDHDCWVPGRFVFEWRHY